MQNAVPKEGPCAPLFYSVAVVLLLSANIAVAQSVDLPSLERCASLETEESKLTCFEALIVTARASNAQPIDAPSTAVAGAVSANVTEIVAAPDTAKNERSVSANDAVTDHVTERSGNCSLATTPVSDPEPVVSGVVPEDAIPRVESAPETEDQQDLIANRASVPAADFGAEQLSEPNRDENKMITATVVEVRRGYNRALSFYMASGQVWRQIEPRRLQYPRNETFEVTISQGMLGEYRLRIGEKGRLVKIRRVK